MAKKHRPQVSLSILILCLCLGSLAILPVMNVGGTPALEVIEVASENSSSIDHAEFDNEFVAATMAGLTFSTVFFSKSRPTNLDFETVRLSTDSPPPKYT